MTTPAPSPAPGSAIALDRRRKRLKFRSWHRGTKEMDLLLGPFADSCLDGLEPAVLDEYEDLLEQPEPDVYDWILERAAPPAGAGAAILARIIAFHARRHAR